ncbi:dUTP diphosphatase [archaeon]
MRVFVKKIHPDAVIPAYAHEGDAGVDLYAVEDTIVLAGERKLLPTGLQISFPEGFEAQIRPKSGLALKKGLSIVNTPGTIDAGYRGEVGVIAVNLSTDEIQITKGMKIAQMVFNKVEEAQFREVNELDPTLRGEGGFGSTGE